MVEMRLAAHNADRAVRCGGTQCESSAKTQIQKIRTRPIANSRNAAMRALIAGSLQCAKGFVRRGTRARERPRCLIARA